MIKRLRKRFIRIAMLAVTSVTLLLCIIINTANFLSVNAELTELLQVIGDNRGTIPPKPFGGRPDGIPGGKFTPETPYSTRYFVLYYTADGTLTGADLKSIVSVTEDDTQTYLHTALRHGEGCGFTKDGSFKFLVKDSGEGRYMAVFLDCRQEIRSIWLIAALSLIAMVVCIIIVYIVVVLFSRRAIDPVVRASEKQKQFITDAGHELKTPITVIATCLKVLEMENGPQKWNDKAKAQTEKLTKLVNSLVSLSRMDEEDSPLRLSRFPVSDAVRETAESFADFAASAGHTLTLAIEPDLTYCGDEYAVRQLVSILLDNAVKYAAPDTPITVSFKKAKRGVLLRTANVCAAPVEPQQLDRLFDRFYRADPARSGSSESFGIGLSIARSIVEGHKGTIRAECRDGRTIEFIAELR